MKIAILGNKEAIMGFKALGVDIFGVKEKSEAENAIEEIYSKNEYAVLIITEDWFLKIKDKIEKFSQEPLPAVLFIPGIGPSMGVAGSRIKKIIEQAIGSDLIFEKID
ncbi:MAG: V-type ATP synthase subunit F [Candidatus Nealsonbacteria bacterium]